MIITKFCLVLCVRPDNFQVHVGQDQRGLVIRAFRAKYSLQLIPAETFCDKDQSDLPGPLLHDHFHWL